MALITSLKGRGGQNSVTNFTGGRGCGEREEDIKDDPSCPLAPPRFPAYISRWRVMPFTEIGNTGIRWAKIMG